MAHSSPAVIGSVVPILVPRRSDQPRFKLVHARPQVIKYGGTALQQCSPIERGFYTARAAIEQAHSDGMLQIGNDLRYDWLRDRKMFGRFRHAAPLRDGEKNLQVPQFSC